MLLLMLLAGHRLLKEKDREAGLYQKEHSIFENIRICGPGAGSGRISEKEEKEDSEAITLLPADSRQMICLCRDEDERWAAYIPSDLSERSFIRFEHFRELILKTGEKDLPELSLRSGDRVPWSVYPDGSVLHATAVGWNNKTLEEAEIVLYSADSVPTFYLSTASGSMDAVNADKSVVSLRIQQNYFIIAVCLYASHIHAAGGFKNLFLAAALNKPECFSELKITLTAINLMGIGNNRVLPCLPERSGPFPPAAPCPKAQTASL